MGLPKRCQSCCRKCFLLQGTLLRLRIASKDWRILELCLSKPGAYGMSCFPLTHMWGWAWPGIPPGRLTPWLLVRCRSGAPRNRVWSSQEVSSRANQEAISHLSPHQKFVPIWSIIGPCIEAQTATVWTWNLEAACSRSSQFHPKHHVSGSACRAFQELGIRGVSKWQQQDGRGFSETNGEHHDLWSRLQYIGWCVERHVFPSSDACSSWWIWHKTGKNDHWPLGLGVHYFQTNPYE